MYFTSLCTPKVCSTSANAVVELSLVLVPLHHCTQRIAAFVALYHVPGGQALGPFQWQAPEVCKEITAAVSNQAATLATTPSDVYMLGACALSSALCCVAGRCSRQLFKRWLCLRCAIMLPSGGLLFELLTGGTHPYSWFRGFENILISRRRSTAPVPVPGSRAPGLADKHVLEAAEVDGERVPWAIAPDLPWLSTVELEQAVRRVMVDCLAYLPESRPKLTALGESLRCV